MADLTIDDADVRIVRMYAMLPDGPAAEAVNAGQPVRLDGASGQYTLANGTAAGEAAAVGIAINTANAAGATLTVMKAGILNVGDALDAASFGDQVQLSNTDGTLDIGGAPTVATPVGRVAPGWASGDPANPDKLLLVDL